MIGMYATANLGTVKLHLRCPLCGSRDISLDAGNGVLVCRSCGYVIDDLVFDYTAPGGLEEGERRPARRRRGVQVLRLMQARAEYQLANIVGADSKLFVELSPSKINMLVETLSRNRCLKLLVKRLPRNEAAAVLHIVYMLLLDEYPLASYIAELYDIPRTRIRTLTRKASKCLESLEAQRP